MEKGSDRQPLLQLCVKPRRFMAEQRPVKESPQLKDTHKSCTELFAALGVLRVCFWKPAFHVVSFTKHFHWSTPLWSPVVVQLKPSPSPHRVCGVQSESSVGSSLSLWLKVLYPELFLVAHEVLSIDRWGKTYFFFPFWHEASLENSEKCKFPPEGGIDTWSP